MAIRRPRKIVRPVCWIIASGAVGIGAFGWLSPGEPDHPEPPRNEAEAVYRLAGGFAAQSEVAADQGDPHDSRAEEVIASEAPEGNASGAEDLETWRRIGFGERVNPEDFLSEQPPFRSEPPGRAAPLRPPPLNTHLPEPPESMSDAKARAERSRLAGTLREWEERERTEAAALAETMGLPVWHEAPDGRIIELFGFDDGQPLYRTTLNRNAAIAGAADHVRNRAPYFASGEGVPVGVWDGGSIRQDHPELDGRVVLRDTRTYADHSTHVAGTIAAAGVHPSAEGMAPAAILDSHDWVDDLAELLERGAAYPGEEDTVALTNHSYGLITGWFNFGGIYVFTGHERYGRYDVVPWLTDFVAHQTPYTLQVWSAGNSRTQNPRRGDSIVYDNQLQGYSATVHPRGDGRYKDGYDTISAYQLAKNVLTVGAAQGAVVDGQRSASAATSSDFTSWGPTDDGRLKPDLVAHGVDVFSSIATDRSYRVASGTSMAAPSVVGSAALLVDYYKQLFPGHALRASTWKSLLVHTADDLGEPGPDYRFGWGLLNTEAAAKLLREHGRNPSGRRIIEGLLTGASGTDSFVFVWDGESPIRATVSWSDPQPEASIQGSDDPTPVLVNNLDVTVSSVTAGSVFYPFVLDAGNPDEPATRGLNDVDNVLQVLVPEPPAAGVYRVNISHRGDLAGGEQAYSLIVSGASVETVEPLGLFAATPPTGADDDPAAVVDLIGKGILGGAKARLLREGEEPIEGFGVEATPERARVRFDLRDATHGLWDVALENPDGEIVLLPEAFSVEPGCQISLTMSEAHFSVEGGREVVHVSADKECVWGATTDADWLSIYLARRMGGTWTKGIVYFDVAPNNDTSLQREGTVTVGDQTIRVVQEGAPEVPLVAGEVREDSVHSDTRQAAWKYYWIDVPPNSRGELDVRLLNATAQANLYVRYGEKPTLHDYDCRPFFGGTSTEHCFLMDPAPGRWWIGVNNWDQRRIDYKVTATYSVRETRFTEWQAAYFSTAERDDPDVSGTQADPGDYGIKNLLRYAFVLDPRQPAREGLPVVRFDRSGPDPVALLEYRRPTAAVDLTYQAEASSDLLDWAPASGESEIVPVSPGVERVRIRLPVPDSGARRKFLRLRVRYDADG